MPLSVAGRSIQCETDIQGDLPILNLPILYITARLHNLEPAQVVHGLGGHADRSLECFFDAFRRRTRQLDRFVYMARHITSCQGYDQVKFSRRPAATTEAYRSWGEKVSAYAKKTSLVLCCRVHDSSHC